MATTQAWRAGRVPSPEVLWLSVDMSGTFTSLAPGLGSLVKTSPGSYESRSCKENLPVSSQARSPKQTPVPWVFQPQIIALLADAQRSTGAEPLKQRGWACGHEIPGHPVPPNPTEVLSLSDTLLFSFPEKTFIRTLNL